LKTFRRRREAELKNGRVAMFATMGCSLARSGAWRRMLDAGGWIQLILKQQSNGVLHQTSQKKHQTTNQ
jgi:hypothetical protein